MTTISESLQTHLLTILNIARLAPSVHNTQPWLVSSEGASLLVAIDKQHALTDGDPTGRETIISLGIFAEAVSLAAGLHGLALAEASFKDNIASLVFEASAFGADDGQIQALSQRCSDRSIYSPTEISPETLAIIANSSQQSSITVHATTNATIINTVADLTGKAIGVALSSPSFRNELADYLVLPGSPKRRGIAVKSLYINPLFAALEPTSLRLGIGIGKEAKLEYRRWLSASGLVIITADGDMPKYWFETGRAYLRASLAIERAGLSQATSAAIVEASNYHDDIEELLGTKQRILAVIRIGKGSPRKEFSPRIAAKDLLLQ